MTMDEATRNHVREIGCAIEVHRELKVGIKRHAVRTATGDPFFNAACGASVVA